MEKEKLDSFEKLLGKHREEIRAGLQPEKTVGDWEKNQAWFVDQFMASNTPENNEPLRAYITMVTQIYSMTLPALDGKSIPQVPPKLQDQLLEIRPKAIEMLAQISVLYNRFAHLPAGLPMQHVADADALKQTSVFAAALGMFDQIILLEQMDDLILKLFA